MCCFCSLGVLGQSTGGDLYEYQILLSIIRLKEHSRTLKLCAYIVQKGPKVHGTAGLLYLQINLQALESTQAGRHPAR